MVCRLSPVSAQSWVESAAHHQSKVWGSWCSAQWLLGHGFTKSRPWACQPASWSRSDIIEHFRLTHSPCKPPIAHWGICSAYPILHDSFQLTKLSTQSRVGKKNSAKAYQVGAQNSYLDSTRQLANPSRPAQGSMSPMPKSAIWLMSLCLCSFMSPLHWGPVSMVTSWPQMIPFTHFFPFPQRDLWWPQQCCCIH